MSDSVASYTAAYSPFDNPLPPKVDIDAGLKSHFFQPPSSASTSLQSSTASLRSSAFYFTNTKSRKRSRIEFSCDSIPALSGPQTPPPLTNVRYKLAAEADPCRLHDKLIRSPFGIISTSQSQRASPRGIDYINLFESDGEFSHNAETLPKETGIDQLPSSPGIRDGLGNAIYRFAGVAGKVWQDWSSTFRGFCAGGGQGYGFKPLSTSGDTQNGWQVICRDENWQGRGSIPATPGGFPEDDYIPDYMSQDPNRTPARATKRSRGNSGTTEKWVMIGATNTKETSPSRFAQRKVPPSTGSTRRTEKRASSRRPTMPASPSSVAGSPRPCPARASFASPRPYFGASASSTGNSPASAEVQWHAARIQRKEAEEYAHLKRFNQQLKAMIREGKEALGTKFEIEDDIAGEYLESSDIFMDGAR